MTLTRVSFEVTNRCNLECGHCLRDHNVAPIDISLDLMRRVLTQAKEKYNIVEMSLTGGELFLHPKIKEIFELASEFDLKLSMVTNATLLPRFIHLIAAPAIRQRITGMCVSLEGYNAELNDLVRGPGSFKKAMAGILQLKAHNIPFRIKYTINKHNYKDMEKAVMSISHLGAGMMEISPMMPTPDNVRSGLLASPDETRKAEMEVGRLMSEVKMYVVPASGIYLSQPFYSCSALSQMDFYVDVNGFLGFCCMLPGLRGRDPNKEPDIIADLNKTDLWEAHQKLLSMIVALQRDRIRKIGEGKLTKTDYHQCVACQKFFGKFDWIRNFPDSPWYEPSDPEEKPPCVKASG